MCKDDVRLDDEAVGLSPDDLRGAAGGKWREIYDDEGNAIGFFDSGDDEDDDLNWVF